MWCSLGTAEVVPRMWCSLGTRDGDGLSALCLFPECGVLWEHEMGILANLYMRVPRMWCSLGTEQSLNVHPRTRVEL